MHMCTDNVFMMYPQHAEIMLASSQSVSSLSPYILQDFTFGGPTKPVFISAIQHYDVVQRVVASNPALGTT